MTLLPVIVACAAFLGGDRCGSWTSPEFFLDPVLCERSLQDSMETLLRETVEQRGEIYWIEGECKVVRE